MDRSIIRETMEVHAPIGRCWALSTRVELVQKTLGMTPVAGVTQGFIEAGSRVTWSGWKFGLPTRHHTLIARFEPPHSPAAQPSARTATPVVLCEAFFQDKQEKGRFASFHHDHFLCEEMVGNQDSSGAAAEGRVTVLTDEVHFRLPFGWLGEIVANRILQPYIRKLTRERFAMIKQLAEGDGWQAWV